MATVAMALPVARRSPARVPRRDLAAGVGDDLTLRIALVQSDRPEAATLNLFQLRARIAMRVWREAENGRADYGAGWRGALASSGSAMATAAEPDVAKITLRAADPDHWAGGGRLGFTLQADFGGVGTALCWGTLHIGPDLGLGPFAVLTGDGRPVLTDTGAVVLY